MKIPENKIVNLRQNSNQSNTGLLISGEVFISGSTLFGTEIYLLENAKVLQKFTCCSNGFFYFKLDYNKQYKVVVQQNGYEEKVISFDTSLKTLNQKLRYYEFGVSMRKLNECSTSKNNNSIAAIIKYNEKMDEFEHDRNYHDERLKNNQSNNAA